MLASESKVLVQTKFAPGAAMSWPPDSPQLYPDTCVDLTDLATYLGEKYGASTTSVSTTAGATVAGSPSRSLSFHFAWCTGRAW